MSSGWPHRTDLRPDPGPAQCPRPKFPPHSNHLVTRLNTAGATAPIWSLTHGLHPTKRPNFSRSLNAHVHTPDPSACSDWLYSTCECFISKQAGNSALFVPEDGPTIRTEFLDRCEDVEELQIPGQIPDLLHDKEVSDADISFGNLGSSLNEETPTHCLGLGEMDEKYSDLMDVKSLNFNLRGHLGSGDDKAFRWLEPNCCFLVDDKCSCTDVSYSNLDQLTIRRRDTGASSQIVFDSFLPVSLANWQGTAESRHQVTQTNQINLKANESGGGCDKAWNNRIPVCLERVAEFYEGMTGHCWKYATLELPNTMKLGQIDRSVNGSNRCHSQSDIIRSTETSEHSAMDNNNNGNKNNSLKRNGSGAESNKKGPGSSNRGNGHEVRSKGEQGRGVNAGNVTHTKEVGSGDALRQLNSNRRSEELAYLSPCLDNSGNSTSAQLQSDSSFNTIFFGDDPNVASIKQHTGTGTGNAASLGSLHSSGSHPAAASKSSDLSVERRDLSVEPRDPRAACNNFLEAILQDATCSLALDDIKLEKITTAKSGEVTTNNCFLPIEATCLPVKHHLSVVDSLAHAQSTVSSVCSGNRLLSGCTRSGAAVENDVVQQTMGQQLRASPGHSGCDSHVTDNSEKISLKQNDSYVALDSPMDDDINQRQREGLCTLNEVECSLFRSVASTSTCQQHDKSGTCQDPFESSTIVDATSELADGDNNDIETMNFLSSLNKSMDEYFDRRPDSAHSGLSARNEDKPILVPPDSTLLERLLKNMVVGADSTLELDWELPELELMLPSWASEKYRKSTLLPECDIAGNLSSDSTIQNSDATSKNQSNPVFESTLASKQVDNLSKSRMTPGRKVIAPAKTAADRETVHSPGITRQSSTVGDSPPCLCGLPLCGLHSQSRTQGCLDALLEPHISRISKEGSCSKGEAGSRSGPTLQSEQPTSSLGFQVDEFTSLEYATSLSCGYSGDQNIFSENVFSGRSSPELTESDSQRHPFCATHPRHTVSASAAKLTSENSEAAVADPVVGDESSPSRTIGKVEDSEGYIRTRILKAKERRRKLLQEMDEITSCVEAYHLPRYDGRWFYDARCGRRELRHAYEKPLTEADLRKSSDEFRVVGTLTIENVHPPVDGLVLSAWGH